MGRTQSRLKTTVDEEYGSNLQLLESKIADQVQRLEAMQVDLTAKMAAMEQAQRAQQQGGVLMGAFQSLGLGDDATLAGQGASCLVANSVFRMLRYYTGGVESDIGKACWLVLIAVQMGNNLHSGYKVLRAPNKTWFSKFQFLTVLLVSLTMGMELEPVGELRDLIYGAYGSLTPLLRRYLPSFVKLPI